MSVAQIDCLADTSAVIKLIRCDRVAIAVMDGKDFAITFITAAELHVGILKATHRNVALSRMQAVLSGKAVLYPSAKTPVRYAEIFHRLE